MELSAFPRFRKGDTSCIRMVIDVKTGKAASSIAAKLHQAEMDRLDAGMDTAT